MNLVPLQALPNQTVSTVLEGNRYDITIQETNGVMAATVLRNDIPVISGLRITAGTLLFPYLYEESGNFIFLNLNDDLIYYPNFSLSQNLFYLTVADLVTMRANYAQS